MSQLKYLYLFNLRPSKRICNYFSLKKTCMTSLFISISILAACNITDWVLSTERFMYISLKHNFFSALNYCAFVLMVKSLNSLEYKIAYFGYMAFIVTFAIHIILFMINTIFSSHFSAIWMYYVHTPPTLSVLERNMLIFTFPNLIYLLFELMMSWICYSCAKNLSLGNDALVDGQNFDRYFENLGSEIGSHASNEFKNQDKNMVNNSIDSFDG